MVTLSGPSGVTAKTPLRMGVECMIPAPGCIRGTDSSREPASRSVIALGASAADDRGHVVKRSALSTG